MEISLCTPLFNVHVFIRGKNALSSGTPNGGRPHAMAQLAQWLIRPCISVTNVKILLVFQRFCVNARVTLAGIKFMFLVGGFADSPMLQTEVRNEFQHVLKIIIPNEVSLAVLRGQSRLFQGHWNKFWLFYVSICIFRYFTRNDRKKIKIKKENLTK